jgi:hypothetical protein
MGRFGFEEVPAREDYAAVVELTFTDGLGAKVRVTCDAAGHLEPLDALPRRLSKRRLHELTDKLVERFMDRESRKHRRKHPNFRPEKVIQRYGLSSMLDRPTRKRLDDRFLARIVAFYVERCEDGSRQAKQETADRFGIKSLSTLDNHLRTAAHRDLYVPPGQGNRGGGTLRPKCRRLLAAEFSPS